MDPALIDDPWQLFDAWFTEALSVQPHAPAFTLATVADDGKPSARVVLYKGRSASGLRFFTNYTSRKARELAQHPGAAAVFYWPNLHRQVRFEGLVEQLSAAESDEYFRSRPRDSQLGAWASPQSQPLERGALETRMAAERARFEGSPVPRPPHWGGYRLIPSSVEFWLPHDHRLNERWLYSRNGEAWERHELAP